MTRSECLRKLQLAAIPAAGLLPLAWILLGLLRPGLLGLAWLWPLGYFLLAFGLICLKGRWRLRLAAPLAVLLTAAALYQGFGAALTTAVFAALLVASMPMGGWGPGEEHSVMHTTLLACVQLAGQLALHHRGFAAGLLEAGANRFFLGSFLVFLLLTLLAMNRRSLRTASGKRKAVPTSMRGKNAAMTLGLFLLTIGLSLIPFLCDRLKQLLLILLRLLGEVLMKLLSRPGGNAGGGGGAESPQQLLGALGAAEASPFALLMERIFRYIAAAAIVVLAGYLLYQIGRRLWRLLRRLLASVNRFAQSAGEDYEDEISDTREAGERRRVFTSLRRRPVWRDDPAAAPAQRIRSRLGYLRARSKTWSPGTTAREALPAEAAAIYEKARYSTHPVSREEAERFIHN